MDYIELFWHLYFYHFYNMPPQTRFQRIALRFTKWVGSPSFIIIHTFIFALCFISVYFGVELDKMLLILTTVVSLEAIYLAIFIQMSVNSQSQSIQEVAEDIDEIQEDVDEIQEYIDEIQEDVDEIQEDVEDVASNVDDVTLNTVFKDLKKLMEDVEKLKQQNNDRAKL